MVKYLCCLWAHIYLGPKCLCAPQKMGRCILGVAAAKGRGATAYQHNIWTYHGGNSVPALFLVTLCIIV